MTDEQIRQQIKDGIEKYHQDHWQALYPAGRACQEWAIDAILENVVKPLHNQIAELTKVGDNEVS